jgi:hypothetical protein
MQLQTLTISWLVINYFYGFPKPVVFVLGSILLAIADIIVLSTQAKSIAYSQQTGIYDAIRANADLHSDDRTDK